MRRRLSYANITATLALVFAMSGGALAASHYLINSTKQINPKVLKKLKGNAGKAGANGANGANGATGATGAQGPGGKEGKEGTPGKEGKEGPLLATLPSGKTLTGAFGGGGGVAESGGAVEASISYPFPLAANPHKEVIQAGGTSTSNCPGTAGTPSAAAGYLCVYVSGGNEVHTTEVRTYGDDGVSNYMYGGVVWVRPSCTAPCHGEFWGTWAVTAP